MNRLLPFVLSLLGTLLLTSNAAAFSQAAASASSSRPVTSQTTSFAAYASATESGPSLLVRHLRHPLSVMNQADATPSIVASQGQNSGWLICLVIVIGGVIFALAHLRKS